MRYQLTSAKWPAFFVILIILTSACDGDSETGNPESFLGVDTLSESIVYDTMFSSYQDPSAMNKSLHQLYNDSLYIKFDTIHINNQVYFLSEGDILLTESEFISKLYYPSFDTGRALISHRRNQKVIVTFDPIKGDTIKWKSFPIRFAINKSSFSSIANGYDSVRKNFLKATADWSALCNVSFQYIPEADTKTDLTNYKLDFTVQYSPNGLRAATVATAFYPNDSPYKRVVFIYPSYWNTPYSKSGILRHEIGHILGFRHEHASKIPAVPRECRRFYGEADVPNIPITTYDNRSVMHYFCGGAGTQAMEFSKNDSLGFTTIYGKK